MNSAFSRLANAKAKSIAPFSSGKGGIGFGLFGNDVRQRQAGGGQCFEQHFFAHAVQRGIDVIQIAFWRNGQRCDLGDIGIDHFVVQNAVVAAAGEFGDGRGEHAVDVLRHFFIGRRHDLPAAVLFAQIDFVAVVLGGVVAGGDHNAGGGVEMADGERQNRRGQHARQQQGFDTGGGHDFGGVFGEGERVFAPVIADDDGRGVVVVAQVVGQSFGGFADQDAVHARAAGSDFAAQACGAELHTAVKQAVQGLFGGFVAVLRLGEQVLDVFAGFGIGVLCGPCLGGAVQWVHAFSFGVKGFEFSRKSAGAGCFRRCRAAQRLGLADKKQPANRQPMCRLLFA